LVETHLDLILKSRSVVKINVCTLTSVANVLILDERRPTREKCKGDEIRCIEDTGNKYELCFTIDFTFSDTFDTLNAKNVSPQFFIYILSLQWRFHLSSRDSCMWENIRQLLLRHSLKYVCSYDVLYTKCTYIIHVGHLFIKW
jgi:hypothetical protein